MALFAEKGADAVTIRAIAAAAFVQPPTIFRHFGDKDGLLDAIAGRIMADFLERKSHEVNSGDPVEDLRLGMEAFIFFGVRNPDIFFHMFARRGRVPEAALAGLKTLRERVRKAALTGRMAVSEQRAFDIIDGMSRGVVISMLEHAEEDHPSMIAAAGDAVLAAVLTGEVPSANQSSRSAAALLAADLERFAVLSPGERLLLSELLSRMANDRANGSKNSDGQARANLRSGEGEPLSTTATAPRNSLATEI